MTIERIKQYVQSCHINFLFGSGLSCPFLSTLGNVEQWLTELSTTDKDSPTTRNAIETNILVKYVENVMFPCIEDLDEEQRARKNKVLFQYAQYLQVWNKIIARRHIGLLDKQINVFTTNIDNLVEEVAENLGIEFNQGFKGQMKPTFNESAFSNVVSKVSPLYHTTATIPVFNYLKVHGSINWASVADGEIVYDMSHEVLFTLREDIKALRERDLIYSFEEYNDLHDMIVSDSARIGHQSSVLKSFLQHYKALVMVNPRKEKFRESVIDLHFYELMRLYSNALERSNSVLFVAGFSFADEHIAQITVRAANANPTLQIIVFSFNEEQKSIIRSNLSKGGNIINPNILILTPEDYRKASSDEKFKSYLADLKLFDLESINKFVFEPLANLIS